MAVTMEQIRAARKRTEEKEKSQAAEPARSVNVLETGRGVSMERVRAARERAQQQPAAGSSGIGSREKKKSPPAAGNTTAAGNQETTLRKKQAKSTPASLSLYTEGEDIYAKVNAWRDASPRNRELEKVLRAGKREAAAAVSLVPNAAASAAVTSQLAQGKTRPWTDQELEAMGYSPEEVRVGREMVQQYDALSPTQKAGRRVAHSAAGVADQLAGGLAMTVGALPSAAADLVGVETKDSSRKEKLKAAIRRVDGTNGAYTDEDLVKNGGWTMEEVRQARAEMAQEGSGVDNPLYNWGKEQHQQGQRFTADAMAGESDAGKFWHGAATSAAENLLLAAGNPAAVLPVLTAQTVGDSMAESEERGEAPGKALARAAAKGAVGYGVEQLGVEQMLAGMGQTGAGGWAAALVDKLGNNPVAQAAPGIWSILAGAGEEAGEELTETYADALVDALMDGETGTLGSRELLEQAVAAAAGGAAGGALIGAGATGYRKAAEARQERAQARAEAEAARRVSAQRAAAQAVQAAQAAQTASEGAAQAAQQAALAETRADPAAALETAQALAEAQAMDEAQAAPEAAQKAQKGPYRGDASEDIWEEDSPETAPETAQETAPAAGPETARAAAARPQAETVRSQEKAAAAPARQAGVSGAEMQQASQQRAREEARQELTRRRISPQAAKLISEQAPAGVSGESWGSAAATLYRIGRSGEAESFDRAVEIAQGNRGLGVDTASVLAQGEEGRTALKLAWAQGLGEHEAGIAVQDGGKLGGPVTAQSFAVKGKVRREGTLRMDSEAATQLIALNAAATGTDAVLQNRMAQPVGTRNARASAAINTETGKIFFGDDAGDVLGSVLHEDLHWYNTFDEEGGRAFQQSLLGMLAAEYGQEDVESLRSEYRRQYRNLSEDQVEEEMAADAVRGLFTEPEHLEQWVRVQRKEAEKNGEKRGIIRKVMDSIRGMLDNILDKARELLRIDPENRAAKRAAGMAEERKEILRAEYYQHMEQAGEARRAAAQRAREAEQAGQIGQAEQSSPAVRYEMAEKAAKESAGNIQRQASRSIMEEEGSAGLDILTQALGLSRGVRVLDKTLDDLAGKHLKKTGSKASRQSITAQLRAAVDYLRAEGADMAKGQAVVEQIAENILSQAWETDRTLWEQHPELRRLEYTVATDGPGQQQLARRYGSWGEAVKEAKRHGVQLRRQAGYKERNPVEMLENILLDEENPGRALFQGAAQKAGVAGAESLEAYEWLEVLMNVRDSIQPVKHSRYHDQAEFEDAVMVETVSLLQDILQMEEVSKVEMLVEANQKAIRKAAEEGARAAGADEAAADRIGREAAKRAEGPMRETQKLRHTLAAQEKEREAQRDELEEWKRTTRDVLKMYDIVPKATPAAMQRQLVDLYEKEARRQQQTLERVRKEMLDEAELEYNQEKARLEWELKGERQRADRAEWQLIVQEDEILDWEKENQRKKEEWERKQAERDAQAMELAQQMEGEEGKLALLAEKRVERAKDGRRRDQLRRSIRTSAAQLNQMLLRPKDGSYVQEYLLPQAAAVARMAGEMTVNKKTVGQLNTLIQQLEESAKAGEIDNSDEVTTLMGALTKSLESSRSRQMAKLQQQLAKAEAMGDSQKAEELRSRIKGRIRRLDDQNIPLKVSTDELAMMNAALKGTLHMIRVANQTVSLEKSQNIEQMATKAAEEVRQSQGNGLFGVEAASWWKDPKKWIERKAKAGELQEVLRTLSPKRLFAMVGGYQQDGQMDQLGEALQKGQDRQHEIIVGGERLFAPLVQDEKGSKGFAGVGAELVDIGLKDTKGNAVPLTRAQLCSLRMHLQNKDSLNHLMTGGFVVPDPELYQAGEIAAAYQNGHRVSLMDLGQQDLAHAVDAAMGEYEREWVKTMREFFDHYTTDIINDTSMKLVGYKKAAVQNYYPISVDSGSLAKEIDGLKHDGTIAGRGFLKNRQVSKKPILLEECQDVVQRSLRDAADYGGLALAIRDVQRVLNASVETEDGPVVLKSKIIAEKWGKDTVAAIDQVLTDLQSIRTGENDHLLKRIGKLRGNYAQAVLGMNTGVVLSQVSGAAANGAVLDGEATMKTMIQFVRNLRPAEQRALRERMREHGDSEMEWRMLGDDGDTLADVAGKKKRLRDLYPAALEALHLPEGMTLMDEATVSAAWAGAESYVNKHPEEFGLESEDVKKQSEDYWTAVRELWHSAMQTTQPGAGVMQQSGRMRSKDGFLLALNMFKGQSYQNKGLLLDAVGEYRAARKRWGGKDSAEAKERMQKAEVKLKRAVTSQVVSAALFALSRMLRDLLLRREELWQDENGDVSMGSVAGNFALEMAGSLVGGMLFGQGLFTWLEHVLSNARYNLFELTGLDGVENFTAAMGDLHEELFRDTDGLSEEQLERHYETVMGSLWDLTQAGGLLVGLPLANINNLFQGLRKWKEKGLNFSSVPKNPAGQYDRLYAAFEEKDLEEAGETLAKLEQMGKEEKDILPQMKKRLKESGATEEAAKLRLEGRQLEAALLTEQLAARLAEAMNIPEKETERRAEVANMIDRAVEETVDQELTGEGQTSPYDSLTEAARDGDMEKVQKEARKLMQAGKETTVIKRKITEEVRPVYQAADERQRKQMNQVLLRLEDEEGKRLYTAKEVLSWLRER